MLAWHVILSLIHISFQLSVHPVIQKQTGLVLNTAIMMYNTSLSIAEPMKVYGISVPNVIPTPTTTRYLLVQHVIPIRKQLISTWVSEAIIMKAAPALPATQWERAMDRLIIRRQDFH